MAPTVDESHPVKKGPSALRSIIAGSTAGAIEIGMRPRDQTQTPPRNNADNLPS